MCYSFENAKRSGHYQLNQKCFRFAIDIAVADSGKFWWQTICNEQLKPEKKEGLFKDSITTEKLLQSGSLYINPRLESLGYLQKSQNLDTAKFVVDKPQTARIAIIGEPGAGKTTRLLQLAEWIHETRHIAIWVSLPEVWTFLEDRKSLKKKDGLRQYLLEDWLQNAV